MTEIYSRSYHLNFTQCYANGVLKYSELSNLLQLTAAEHAVKLGFGYFEMARHEQAWVLSRVRIEIEKLPRFLEEITIRTWIQDFLGNRSVRNFEVIYKGVKIIGATTFWAVFNVRERKSENLWMDIKPELIYHEKVATQSPFQKIQINSAYQYRATHIPKLSDLDIVNHVNNVKYTDWCLDVLPSEIVLGQAFHSIDINYLKELKLGQAADIEYTCNDEEIAFAIQHHQHLVFLMKIQRFPSAPETR